MRRDHQKYIRECLAQAIFHKVLDMERRHQIDIKRKLETFARKQRVQRLKVDHTKRDEQETFPAFSPRPPTGPKSGFNRRPGNHERYDSSDSASSLRPNTAPGNMQRPVRLQPLPVYSSSGNVPKISTVPRQKHSADEEEQRFTSTTDKEIMRIMHTTDLSVGISPYRLPIINNFVIPVPPPPQKHPKQTMSTSSRGRRYRPTTAPNGPEVPVKDTGKFHKTSLHSNVKITMVYLGKNVHLSHENSDYRDEIRVFQQHCGGENLCVYKGRLLEEESFTLVSRRHRGFPFSLTFYINGIQVDRLSSCCEFKHRKGVRLGGKNAYFGFINIEGASPCYRCIISMGLDKKPSPPPKSKAKKKDSEEESDEDHKDKEEMEEEVSERRFYDEVDNKLGKTSSVCDDDDDEVQKMEDKSAMDCEEEEEEKEENKDCKTDEYEADDEAKDDYDEDFEVEEYKPDEKHNEEGQVDDQVNEKSKSPSDDEKDDLNQERRSSTPSNAAPGASDRERDERDGRRDSDDEEGKQDRKRTDSFSSSSSIDSPSSEESSDHDDHEAESDQEKEIKETKQEVDNHDLDKDREAEEPEEVDKELLETHVEELENIDGHDDVDEPLSEDRKPDCVSPDNGQVNDGETLGHMDEEDKSEVEDDSERRHSSDEEGGEYRQ